MSLIDRHSNRVKAIFKLCFSHLELLEPSRRGDWRQGGEGRENGDELGKLA